MAPERLFALLQRGADGVGVATFAAMLGAFLLQVFFRYGLGRPLGWTDELTLVLYPWAVFWACAFSIAWRDHVAFDVLYRALPPHVRRVFALAGAALVVALFATALPATVDYVKFMARERTPVLGWRYDLVFACFPIFLAALVVRLVLRIRELLRPGWQARL